MVKPIAIVEPGVVERAGIDSLRDAGYEVIMAYTKEGIVLNDRTLRDDFAMAALTGMLSDSQKNTRIKKEIEDGKLTPEDASRITASTAYSIADEMLKARG